MLQWHQINKSINHQQTTVSHYFLISKIVLKHWDLGTNGCLTGVDFDEISHTGDPHNYLYCSAKSSDLKAFKKWIMTMYATILNPSPSSRDDGQLGSGKTRVTSNKGN